MTESKLEQGVVVEVRDGRAVVRLSPPDAETCRRCGLCVEAARAADARRTLEVAAPLGVGPGQTVTVEVSQPDPAKAAALVFAVPLVLTGLGAAVGGAVEGLALAARWHGALAGGAIGFASAFLLAARVARRWQADGRLSSRIVRAGGAEAACEEVSGGMGA